MSVAETAISTVIGGSMKLSQCVSICLMSAIINGCAKEEPKEHAINETKVPVFRLQPDITIPAVSNAIRFDQNISDEVSKGLNEAISLVHFFPMDIASQSTKDMIKLMEIPNSDAASMQTWLEDRVHFIVSEDFDSKKKAIYDDSKPIYPENQILPYKIERSSGSSSTNELFPQAGNELFPQTDKSPAKGQIVMSNMGLAFYLNGKIENRRVVVDLVDIGPVRIESPRTGLLQVGEGLFSLYKRRITQNVLKGIFRVSTLFHEARHSDGHGATLGFLHAKCPTGHDFEGLYACDASTNGPYTVGALMEKNLLAACGDSCTMQTKQIIQMLYLDDVSRNISTYETADSPLGASPGTAWDAAPEFIIHEKVNR